MTQPSQLAERATTEILTDFTTTTDSGVVVDSPPGAGKSTLVVRITVEIAGAGEPVRVVAQTNAQVDDLTQKIAEKLPDRLVGRLSRDGYQPPPSLSAGNIRISTKIDDLRHCPVIIGTAAKWVISGPERWPWAIIDEAYQMRSDTLLSLAPLFAKMLFVGDPGQLDPFSPVDNVDRWEGLPWDPMQSAVAVLMRNNPDLRIHRLPLSWRLPPSATGVIQEAFYPFSPFGPGTGIGDRSLQLPTAGIRASALDEVLTIAATTGWGFYELPFRNNPRTDPETVEAAAAVAARLLVRGSETYCEHAKDGRRLTADRITIGAAHNDQVAAIKRALRAHGPQAAAIRVDTANRLQGAEFDVTVVLHPLSGRIDATAFHLESGRLCVLASRHRHACIVVGRAGIPELLDAHPSIEPMHLNALIKFPDGWEANQAILAHLGQHRVPANS